MPAKLYAGPYDFISIGTVKQAPWYVIPFDNRGRCTGPLTRNHLVRSVADGSFTDIYLFSHGWNNDWRGAVGDDPSGVASGSGYRSMIDSYVRLRQTHKLTYDRDYNPLLIGIFWPSTWLVFPWEQAPNIAADDPQLADAIVDQEWRTQEEIARLLHDKDIEAFYTYMQQEQISEVDARELARIMLPLYQHHFQGGPEDRPIESPASEEQLVELWRTISQPRKPLDTGDEGGLLGGVRGEPEIAGGIDSFDPRMILRGASVWLMKDRAGVVGARGVSSLLIDLLNASNSARVHIIGHSFGCRVLLSSICYPEALPRKVNSALLIQPAVSHLCFATDVAGSEKPGGYRVALDRVEQPLLLTFTEEDQALHD